MSDFVSNGRVLDARPDRIDFRDREYQPQLVSLPDYSPSEDNIKKFLPLYSKQGMILDQGKQGACTGFGLAAVVNYIVWEKWLSEVDETTRAEGEPPEKVSPWMLYDVARVYDEWEGEDYSGSSCRGAMKGWHKHGVCLREYWPQLSNASPSPDPGWASDAARKPLGAYYRVNAASISDMQSAVHEVRAVYCSAWVHKGWQSLEKSPTVAISGLKLPIIQLSKERTGGHAFAVVGYTPDGFIIQNSWGKKWGNGGFAVLTYEDWALNGNDAWVASLAAPMRVSQDLKSPSTFSRQSLMEMSAQTKFSRVLSSDAGVSEWSEEKAYQHAIVMGNDGKLLRRDIASLNAETYLRKVAIDNVVSSGKKDVVVYAHGGLNSEELAIDRVKKLGPWFEANGIHPIFVVWRTSLWNALADIGKDSIDDLISEQEKIEGVFDRAIANAMEKLQSKFDKAFEATAERVVGKSVWSQMKQNAREAANGDGGMRQLALALNELNGKVSGLNMNLLAHSAGTNLIGHFLQDLDGAIKIKTVGLFAPACTIEFAVTHYGRALNAKKIGKNTLYVRNLSDENERDDTVGPYGKSLLYLVSRAFEVPRKAPLLGLHKCWWQTAAQKNDKLPAIKKRLSPFYAESHAKYVRDWYNLCREYQIAYDVEATREAIAKEVGQTVEHIKRTHGSFDNDITIIYEAIQKIAGSKARKKVTDLTGF